MSDSAYQISLAEREVTGIIERLSALNTDSVSVKLALQGFVYGREYLRGVLTDRGVVSGILGHVEAGRVVSA